MFVPFPILLRLMFLCVSALSLGGGLIYAGRKGDEQRNKSEEEKPSEKGERK